MRLRAERPRNCVSIPDRDKRLFFSQKLQHRFLATEAHIQWVPEDLLLGIKRLEPAAEHLAPPNAEVKKSPVSSWLAEGHVYLYLHCVNEGSSQVGDLDGGRG
jgi:hypothetical protein